MTNTQNLPAALKESALFCVWKKEERGGKPTKIGVDCRGRCGMVQKWIAKMRSGRQGDRGLPERNGRCTGVP